MFDQKISRLKLFSGYEWDTYLLDSGVPKIINLLQSYLLDTYELYLIRNIQRYDRKYSVAQLQHYLTDYYYFIGLFKMPIAIQEKTDIDVMGYCIVESTENYLVKQYQEICKTI